MQSDGCRAGIATIGGARIDWSCWDHLDGSDERGAEANFSVGLMT